MTCPRCGGSRYIGGTECPRCDGSGDVEPELEAGFVVFAPVVGVYREAATVREAGRVYAWVRGRGATAAQIRVMGVDQVDVPADVRAQVEDVAADLND